MNTLTALKHINIFTGSLMTKSSSNVEQLAKRVDQLESQQASLIEALKLLLPLALSIPASTTGSAHAIKQLQQALVRAEEIQPRSEDFWHLATAMSLTLSSRAVDQHPTDPEVVKIFQGLRAHKRQ